MQRSFALVDTTLREGEQFAHAFFSPDDKVRLAKLLDELGVEYIELTSPAASPRSAEDCRRIASLGLKAKVLTHVRCHLDDVRLAAETGVDGVNLLFGTSRLLRTHSHGLEIGEIADRARTVIRFLKAKGLEVRFSAEDAFRSDLVDLLALYRAAAEAGVDRVGVADTVGVAHPQQVFGLVRTLAGVVRCGIEFHGHDDTGCAIANTFSALEAGATHLDVSVLGLGERNGIASLEGLIARLYTTDPETVRSKYRLRLLPEIARFVAERAGVEVPFNSCVVGSAAFSHRAGLHVKALLENPRTYEVLDPDDFGVRRQIQLAQHLTGWNAIRHRSRELGLEMSDDLVKQVTALLKARAAEQRISLGDVDTMLRTAAAGGGA